MRNTIYFKWFMESLSDEQKKEYNSYSINQQKDWYIAYLERHFLPSKNQVDDFLNVTLSNLVK
jgi:hypothetical protein